MKSVLTGIFLDADSDQSIVPSAKRVNIEPVPASCFNAICISLCGTPVSGTNNQWIIVLF